MIPLTFDHATLVESLLCRFCVEIIANCFFVFLNFFILLDSVFSSVDQLSLLVLIRCTVKGNGNTNVF